MNKDTGVTHSDIINHFRYDGVWVTHNHSTGQCYSVGIKYPSVAAFFAAMGVDYV